MNDVIYEYGCEITSTSLCPLREQIRAEAFDELVLKLEADMPSKLDAKERYGYTVALTIVMEQLKEQK